jgi:hypothetical protein
MEDSDVLADRLATADLVGELPLDVRRSFWPGAGVLAFAAELP